MSYVDGFVLPVPENRLEDYRVMAQQAGEVWMEHCALAYKECVGEDLNSEFANSSFPKIAGAQTGETVIRLRQRFRPADRLAPIKVSNTITAAAASLILHSTPLAFLCFYMLL